MVVMKVQLQTNLERFVREQVDAGNFPSPEAVVEAALSRMMDEQIELTDEDIEAINISDQQFERGEGISSKDVVARVRQMYRDSKNGAPKV